MVLEEKIFLHFINVFLLFHNFPSLEKGVALHLNKLESPSPKDALLRLIEIGPVVLERKWKMWKVYWQMDRWMDNRRQAIRKAQVSKKKDNLEKIKLKIRADQNKNTPYEPSPSRQPLFLLCLAVLNYVHDQNGHCYNQYMFLHSPLLPNLLSEIDPEMDFFPSPFYQGLR